ncbi:MAG: Rpn family recombination-promoting nuclease/putative transposase [Eubacteriaceae bacterium]|nr:Rpn family recombination-promoting nuclease/putative transposase [Eubacteriaceae bacterium]
MQEDAIDEIAVVNPEILPELIESKFCRLDNNMVASGQNVDLELQVADEGNFKERAMFYISKILIESLKSVKDYIALVFLKLGFPLEAMMMGLDCLCWK